MKLKVFNGANDYNKLSHLPFNRKFKVRPDLTASMNERGFITPINIIETSIITGKKEMFIADGQNRAITAAFLDIPFYGVIVDNVFSTVTEIVEYVASLNSAQKPWNTLNYAESFAYLGNKEYISLIKITQSTPYTIETIASMLYGYRKSGSVKNKMMRGDFIINQLNLTNKTLELAAILSKYEPLLSRMVLALHYVSSLSTFDETKFIKEYSTKGKSIKQLDLSDYTDIFTSWLK